MLRPAPGSARRRRVSGLVLASGLVAAGLGLAEWAPVEQAVTLRLGGERAALRAVDVAVLDDQGETLGESRWNFPSGPPPPSVTLRLRAPRGQGTVRVVASRAEGDASVREHRVRLDGSPLTIALGGDRSGRD
jgi:hypothetical protein